MIKLFLYSPDITPAGLLAGIDIDTLTEISLWLGELPCTKRRKDAFRIGKNKNNIPFIIFVRNEDAVAFKLRFGGYEYNSEV